MVRHYTWLSKRNFGIDTGFYPLGSCTMKHNPRVNEAIAQMPGIAIFSPHQPESHLQGLMSIYYEMQDMLAICAGMTLLHYSLLLELRRIYRNQVLPRILQVKG